MLISTGSIPWLIFLLHEFQAFQPLYFSLENEPFDHSHRRILWSMRKVLTRKW